MIKKGSMVELIGAGWTNKVPVCCGEVNEATWSDRDMIFIEPCLGIVVQDQNPIYYYEVLTESGTYHVFQDFLKVRKLEEKT